MNHFFRKPTATIVLALLLLLLITSSALAAPLPFSGTIGPDARVCLDPFYATTNVDAQGSASPDARFTIHRGTSATFATMTTIYSTPDHTLGFHALFNSSSYPQYFPGYFRLCAKNLNSQTAHGNLTITGN